MTPGQHTYAIYGEYLLNHGWIGLWPPWGELTQLMHDAWEAAAEAARQMTDESPSEVFHSTRSDFNAD